MSADPVSPSIAHYYVDKYRERHEIGRGMKRRGLLCFPGRGGCNEYHFPHRLGSGFCRHNARMSDADREARWQSISNH